MTIGSIAKGCSRFIMGNWAAPIGEEFYQAKLASKTPMSIFSHDWKTAYKDYWVKADAAEALGKTIKPSLDSSIKKALESLPKDASKLDRTKAALKAARTATNSTMKAANAADKKIINELVKKTVKDTANPGFFKKIGNLLGKIPGAKFVGKNFFPLLLAGQAIYDFVKGFQHGGIAEGLKEGSRGLLKMAGWGIATAIIAATLPVSGFVALGLSFLLSSFVFDKAIDFVLGPSVSEREAQEAQLAQQENAQQQNIFASQYPQSAFAAAAQRNKGRSLSSFGALTNPMNPQQNSANIQQQMRALDNMMQTTENMFNNRNNCYTAQC